MSEEYGDKCVRCGEVGEDRRTLWMACLYDMAELKVPFEQVMIKGTRHEMTGTKELRFSDVGPAHTVPVFSETPTYGTPNNYPMFTLRVCKDCRGDWMRAIKTWFNTPVERSGCGSGIYVRKFGATQEVTLEEWERMRAEKNASRKDPSTEGGY